MALLMIFIAQGKTFAEMPDISAGETYFDIMKGVYVLKDNVVVEVNNHGFKAKITADEAKVSVTKQKCWADGKVKLEQEDITFGCERAYLQWATKTAEVTGKVKFENKKGVKIKSDTAIFNWKKKIVDFYGKVTYGGKDYQHIKYNVIENRVLELDETFDAPEIIIPDTAE